MPIVKAPEGSRSKQPAVLVARLPQGRRRRFGQSLIVMAHGVQPIGMRGAVPLAWQARVSREFVDPSPIEIGQPGLDVPAWHDHENPIPVLPWRYLLLSALRLQLRPPGIRGTGIRVRDDDEVGPLPSSDGSQLGGIPCSHPLLARPPPGRKRRVVMSCRRKLAPLEESPYERIGLRVFAEQRDVDSTHALSHPRTIASESETPSTVRSGWSLTRTGPFPSR